jgi:phosphoribosyl 1,2-cyclic phosphate phosphodiesterase
VLNALRPAPHPTHFSVDQARELIGELRPRRAFLVHMTHDLDHESTNVTFPDHIRLAYDGLTIEVDETESYM